jgi:hypothetical protein
MGSLRRPPLRKEKEGRRARRPDLEGGKTVATLMRKLISSLIKIWFLPLNVHQKLPPRIRSLEKEKEKEEEEKGKAVVISEEPTRMRVPPPLISLRLLRR